MKKKPKTLKPGWITVTPYVHLGRVLHRRIAKLLPLRVEPGHKFVPGTTVKVRKVPFDVLGFGYEEGRPVIHLLKPPSMPPPDGRIITIERAA